jgi:hypothetical protein
MIGKLPVLRHFQPPTNLAKSLTTSLRRVALLIEIVSHLTIRLARSPVTKNNERVIISLLLSANTSLADQFHAKIHYTNKIEMLLA